MAHPLQIYIDDTSPSVAYYPFADTFGPPDLLAGWNPYYTDSGYAAYQGQTGKGTSLHRTSLNGASLSIQWLGTGIQLFGSASQASYSLTLDGTSSEANSSSPADGILAEFHDLIDGNHTISLTVHTNSSPSPDSFVSFDEALITSSAGLNDSNSTFVAETINDTDVAFLGHWSYKQTTDGNGHNLSFHYSINNGDRVEIAFQGRTVSLTGFVSDASGQYSVTLDNYTSTMSGRSSFSYSEALLYYATDIDDDRQHQLVVQNMENRVLALKVGGFNYTTTQNGTNSTSTPLSSAASSTNTRGTKAAIGLACVLTFILLALVFGYFLVYRPRARRREYERRAQLRHDKEAEAGGSILDISAENAEQGTKHSSAGTSIRFAGLRFGLGSQQNKSDIISVESNGLGDRQTQWETYTIDLPAVSQDTTRRSSPQQTNQPSRPTPIPNTRPSCSGHTRLGSGAHLLDNLGTRSNDDDGGGGIQTREYDYHGPVELSLSPRTSEAQFVSGFRPPLRGQEKAEDNVERSRVERVREAPYLDIAEGSPFTVDFVGARRSRGDSAGLRKSQLAQLHPQTESDGKPEQSTERQRDSHDGKRISQVKFDTSAEPIPVPRFSFLDFDSTPPSSNYSNDASGSSHRSEPEKSRWSATTVPSQTQSGPRTEPPSTSHASVTFDVPPTPSQQTRPRGPRFPFPISTPNSPHHRQSFGAEQTRPRHSSGPSAPQTAAPSAYHYAEPASPTDSVPMSVSDILFRNNNSDVGSRRVSAVSQFLPAQPSQPSNLQTLPETPTRPFIVQKLLGISTGDSSNPASNTPPPPDVQLPTPEAAPPAHQEVTVPPTPFMQRMFEIGSAAFNPRHNRNTSQDALQPESSKSAKSRP